MRLSTICMTTYLAATSIGIVQANLITSGDFSQTTLTGADIMPTEFAHGYVIPGHTYHEDFVTGWYGNRGLGFWYPDTQQATTEQGRMRFNDNHPNDTLTAPPNSTAFVGLNGDPGSEDGWYSSYQASISQDLIDLIPGATYNVSFDWGASQMQSKTGDTTEYLQVSLGLEFRHD